MSDASLPGIIEPLPDMAPGSQIEAEWNCFRRERPRLLAEGHEGRWVLIKGEEIVGVFDTWREARRAGLQQFGLVPMLVQQLLRCYRPIRAGNYWRCQP
jgi:hypothetical protein